MRMIWTISLRYVVSGQGQKVFAYLVLDQILMVYLSQDNVYLFYFIYQTNK